MEKPPRRPLPEFRAGDTALCACATLEQAGWGRLAEGDWAWVFAAPDGQTVARVTPWDPAYRLYAQVCLRHPENHYLPHVEQVSPLAPGGYVVFMERLRPADQERATALCRALGLGNDTGGEVEWMTAALDTSAFDGDEDLAQLRGLLREAMEYGTAHVPFWGGSDMGPGDVMAAADGRLKLLDPFFMHGQAINDAIWKGDRKVLQQLPEGEVEGYLSIPYLEARYRDGPDVDGLRRTYRALTQDLTVGDE